MNCGKHPRVMERAMLGEKMGDEKTCQVCSSLVAQIPFFSNSLIEIIQVAIIDLESSSRNLEFLSEILIGRQAPPCVSIDHNW